MQYDACNRECNWQCDNCHTYNWCAATTGMQRYYVVSEMLLCEACYYEDIVSDYAANTLSERYADRANDEYNTDIDVRYSLGKGERVTFGSTYRSTADDAKSYTPNPGYDLLGVGHVRCWYCDTEFNYSWFRSGWESHTDAMERFVTEMLTHYSAHRSEGDLPYVRTYIKVGVRRPDGSVTTIPEHARRVTKPWQVKGALL